MGKVNDMEIRMKVTGAETASKKLNKFTDGIKQLHYEGKKTESSNNEMSSSLKSINSNLKLPNLAVLLRGIKTMIEYTETLTTKSIDYIENLNLLDSAFGKNAQMGRQFANTIADIYGFDESNIVSQLGTFRQFGSALGYTAETANLLSKNLTLMAGDISSLYNITVKQASEKLTSALTGQTKAIRSLGADITQASLQQQLYNMGIDESISNMNRAEKTLLIYISLHQQLINAQGDLAKTIESPSNQMKIMREQVARLARSIGNILLPVLATILPVINGVLMALVQLFNFIGGLLGYDPADFEYGGALSEGIDYADELGNVFDETTDSIGGTNDALDETKKKLTGLRGFDKLNVITTPTDNKGGSGGAGSGVAGGGIDPRILKWLSEYNAHLDKINMKAKQIRDKILQWLGLTIDENGKLKLMNGKLTAVQKLVRAIANVFKTIFNIAKDIVVQTKKWGNTTEAKKAFESLESILENLAYIIIWITETLEELYYDYVSPMIPVLLDGLSIIVQLLADILDFLMPILEFVGKLIKFNLEETLFGISIALDAIVGILKLAKKGFETFVSVVSRLIKGDFTGAMEELEKGWSDAFDIVKKTAKEVFDEIVEHSKEKIKEMAEEIPKKLEKIVDWFKELPERLGYLIGLIVGKIIKYFTDPDYKKEIGEKIKEKIFSGLGVTKGDFTTFLKNFKTKLKEKIAEIDWSDVGKAIGKQLIKNITWPYTTYASVMSSLAKSIKKGLENALSGTQITTAFGGTTKTTTASIGVRAEGGFVNTGEMFIAREAGPELVGTIGNKTAVANNDQIVQAVSIGVAKAIQGSNMGNTKVVIDASGDSSGLMDFITFKQRQESRQYGL